MLLKKIARNHPEDTLSDALWSLCKEDKNFAEAILSEYILHLEDFSVIDIVRNYVIPQGHMPDLTFLLRHNCTNKIVYLMIETKIEASQNNSNKSRTKRQYSLYTQFLNIKNSKAKLPQKYKLPTKCILLCPSYYEKHTADDPIIDFRFPRLLEILKAEYSGASQGIHTELIKYIEEEFEGVSNKLKNSIEILQHRNELHNAQNHIKALRKVMITEQNKKRSGLWQKNSFSYYFSIGLQNKYQKKKKDYTWLSYDFYYEDHFTSPLRLYFPNRFLDRGIISFPKYNNKNEFYCDILTEIINNKKWLTIFQYIHCSNSLTDAIANFANYYTNGQKLHYLKQFNILLNSLIIFIGRFDNQIQYDYYTEYIHSCSKDDIILKLKIIQDKRRNQYISLVAEPTCSDIPKILKFELFEKQNKLASTIPLFEKNKSGFRLKYNFDRLQILLSESFEKLYNKNKP